MSLARRFLDWRRPALPAVAEYLIDRYGGERLTDLSGVIVVLTGRRACRRLIEILLEKTDGRLLPPRTITEGEFPEQLYEPQRPFAGQMVQHLAWAEAVRRMPRPQAEQVLRDVPDDGDVDGWMALGELLWQLHRELAAELLDFGDVLHNGQQIAGFNELRRWEALRVAQQEYLDLLDGLGLWDRQTARIVAVRERECHTDRDIILVGTVDLNQSTRAMLDQVTDRVTTLIHSPESLQERFDEHGCLRPEAWRDARLDLKREQVRVVDKPLDQADEVVRILSEFAGAYQADEITVGVADDSLVPQIQRRLNQYGVGARWAVGKTLPQTGLVRLLEAIAAFVEGERTDHFAALARHPDVEFWLKHQEIEPLWLQELDCYQSAHLQQRLGFWLGSSERCRQIRRVHELIARLLTGLSDEARPLTEWSEVVLSLLREVFADRTFDPSVPAEDMELAAIAALKEVLEAHAEIPEPLLPVVSGSQALRLIIGELATETVPPPPDESAIELAGWLELPLDDAPALIVTSFNEEYVPSSVSADLFLPNRLRRQLGITDNDRRYARDAYALSSLLASREQLILVAGRRDLRGDPLLPSRLFFACDEFEAAERVRKFYVAETPPPLPVGGPQSPSFEGSGLVVPQPRPLAEPLASLPVTAFRSYLTCPYRFYLRHVLRLEAVLRDEDEMDGRAFGTLIHAVLGDFGLSEFKDSCSEDEITEYLHEMLNEHSERRYGRFRLPAVSVQIEQARRRLVAFARWQAARNREGWRIAFAEAPSDGAQATFHLGKDRSVFLRGRIDRIDHHAERNEWALLDYKTGDAAADPDKAHRRRGEWIDLQLPLYRHLARDLGVEGTIGLGYIGLPRDTGDVQDRMARWSPDDLADADRKAREISELILDGCFWPPADPPLHPDDFAAICQDAVFDRRLC